MGTRNRIMGLDLGSKRIGIAISDPEGILAQGLTILTHRSRQADLAAIEALAREHEVREIVIGYPLLLSGKEGKEAKSAKRFGAELARRTGLPIVYWDERLSTVAAHRLLLEAGLRSRQRAARVDMAAAELILQHYLDWRKKQHEQTTPNAEETAV